MRHTRRVSALRTIARLRNEADPRGLVLGYGLLSVAASTWIAVVPGEWHYAEPERDLKGELLLDAVVVACLLLRWRAARWAAIFFATLALAIALLRVGLSLFDPWIAFEAKDVGMALLSGAALWLVWSPSLDRWLDRERRVAVG
jgi:hypothetical protein